MRNSIVLVYLLSFLVACSTGNKSVDQAKVEQKSYLALGDSYTVGELVDTEKTFPYLLVDRFNENNYSFKKPTVIATTGWRTDELIGAMKNLKEKHDLVSLLIGVNNQYQGIEIGIFRNEVTKILKQAIGLSKTKEKGVFAYSIPDYSIMPVMRGKDQKKIAEELKIYNEYYREICKSLGVKFYDITPLSQMAAEDTELIANDKLHPSGKMYNLWVQKTFSSIISNHIK